MQESIYKNYEESDSLLQLLKPVAEYHDEILISLGRNFFNFGRGKPISNSAEFKDIFKEFGKWFLHAIKGEKYRIPDLYIIQIARALESIIVSNPVSMGCMTPGSERIAKVVNNFVTQEADGDRVDLIRKNLTEKKFEEISKDLRNLSKMILATLRDFNLTYSDSLELKNYVESGLNALNRINDELKKLKRYFPYVGFSGENYVSNPSLDNVSTAKKNAALLVEFFISQKLELKDVIKFFDFHRSLEDSNEDDLSEQNERIFLSFMNFFVDEWEEKLDDFLGISDDVENISDIFYEKYLQKLHWFCFEFSPLSSEKELGELRGESTDIDSKIGALQEFENAIPDKKAGFKTLLRSINNHLNISSNIQNLIDFCDKNDDAIKECLKDLSNAKGHFLLIEKSIGLPLSILKRYRILFYQWQGGFEKISKSFENFMVFFNLNLKSLVKFFKQIDELKKMKSSPKQIDKIDQEISFLRAGLSGDFLAGHQFFLENTINEIKLYLMEIANLIEKEGGNECGLTLLQENLDPLLKAFEAKKTEAENLSREISGCNSRLEEVRNQFSPKTSETTPSKSLSRFGTFPPQATPAPSKDKETDEDRDNDYLSEAANANSHRST